MATLRAEPQDIQFCEMKQDERSGGENTVSLVVGGKTLYLFNLFDPDNPIELAFQARYGNIVSYKWFGDGYILIGSRFVDLQGFVKPKRIKKRRRVN